MSPKMGRPCKSESEKKIHRLQIRVTDEELNKIQYLADMFSCSKTEILLEGLQLLYKQSADK
nr:hypothetical protein [Ruminococcus bromii]